jgi:hypothetical protein
MPDQNEVPLLLQYLFGEAAETAQRVDSPRLMRWAAGSYVVFQNKKSPKGG